MITKVLIKDNNNAPLNYIKELKNFNNGKEYNFIEGVNIIVGENGSGKSTLLELIKRYLMVDYEECQRGIYNSNVNKLRKSLEDDIYDGIDVYADYVNNTFRLSHVGEKDGEVALREGFESFGMYFTQKHASTGEGVNLAMYKLFNYIFGDKVKLKYDYEKEFGELFPNYLEYIKSHKIETEEPVYTILMDEPDRNLSISKVEELKEVFGYKKPNTQLIAVIHNPLLIYWLHKHTDVNFIEMTEDYIKHVCDFVDNMTL